MKFLDVFVIIIKDLIVFYKINICIFVYVFENFKLYFQFKKLFFVKFLKLEFF